MTWRARTGRMVLGLAFACAAALSVQASSAWAGAVYLHSCSKLNDGGAAWTGAGAGSFSEANRCSQGGSFQINTFGTPVYGDKGQWYTVTPPSIGIVAAYTPPNDVLINPQIASAGYSATFFWGATQQILPTGNCCGGMDYGGGINRTDIGGSHYFGFQVGCGNGAGCLSQSGSQLLDVNGIELEGIDNTPPSTSAPGAPNLWYEANRYVRGAWPTTLQAADDSGICATALVVDGQTVAGSSSSPNQGSWTQCPTPVTINKSIDTANYSDGPLSLQFVAGDAANPANYSYPAETTYVDNQPVSLSLSGRTDAPTTAGTQYITATAAAGPSGVGILCSLDGAPSAFQAGPSAQIAVQGLGAHQVSCYAQNGAIDAGGQPATSPVHTWNLNIRQPTVAAISFGSHLRNALRCHRARETVKVRARYVTVHRHGKRVKVKRRAHTKTIKVMRCHPRAVRVRVRVLVHGHSRLRWERRVLLPGTIQSTTIRVRHGRPTTVSGWLGTSDGVALAGEQVSILTAADNGQNAFRLAASASTAGDGSWSAKLPPGPSRLIEAFYTGASTTEPTLSGQIGVIVPASVKLLRIFPRHVHWNGTVHIVGQLRGGYLPASGALVRLRIGIGHSYSTYGVQEHVTGNGRFSTGYTFGAGIRSVHQRYWFQIASLPVGDYPYAPANSRRLTVLVGG